MDMALHLRSKGHRVMIITQPGAVLGERTRKKGIMVLDIVLKNLSVLNPFVLFYSGTAYHIGDGHGLGWR